LRGAGGGRARALGGGATLVTHVRGGVVYGGGTTPRTGGFIPPQERLYAGGPTTVRGFRQNELGPAVYIVSRYDTVSANGRTFYRADSTSVTERVVPTGGNTLIVGNVEAQFPSPLAPKLLQIALFADAGKLWNRGAASPAATLSDEGPSVKITPGLGTFALVLGGIAVAGAAAYVVHRQRKNKKAADDAAASSNRGNPD
jgi:outer membrane protein assembly factor BamA